MTKISISLLLLLVVPTASAFSVQRMQQYRPAVVLLHESSYPEPFDRAVKCSENFNQCDADELLELAEELEKVQGAVFETDSKALAQKEVKDRKDLADVLRLEAELKRRQEYLQNANLFKADVEEAHDKDSREEYLEHMSEISDS